ncbi:hypothetical protein [Plantactinospora sp. WMMB782]|uniref:hypothetical protein n=1 Tax=Plantactinospora sp. WMMB782 TaxID=3404121 RepID=UPI003B9396D5
MTILDQIDRVTAGLCPCGAPPAEGSAYCSDDCRPTHISDDTDQRESGHLATPMRWRPDLVSDLDDSDLIPVDAPRTGYTGRYNATVFRRRSNPDLLHLRLDDGHRLVGVDVAEVVEEPGRISFETVERVLDTWQRLERELVNPRHTEPVDSTSWSDELDRRQAAIGVFVAPAGTEPNAPHGWVDIGHLSEDGLLVDDPPTRQRRIAHQRHELSEEAQEQIRARVAEGVQAMSTLCDSLRPAMAALVDAFAAACLIAPVPPEDPRERALHARRHRHTGPPPDRLDGRRRRR